MSMAAKQVVQMEPSRQVNDQNGILKSFWNRRASRWGVLELAVLVGVSLFVVMSIVPLFLAFFYSLTNLNPLYAQSDFIGLDNYVDLLDDRAFLKTLSVTVRLTVMVTLAANIGGLLVALMLNHRGVYYSVLKVIFFIPQILSAVIVSFIWRIILTDRGLLNAFLQQIGLTDKAIHWLGKPDMALYSLVIVVTWQLIGFCTVIYLASLQSIPDDLVEAAQIDGANRWRQFRHITWPLLAPGVTINMVLILIITFKLYDQVAVLTGGGPGGSTETLSYYIIRIGFTANQTGYASAMAVILFIAIAFLSGIVVSLLKRREVEF